MKALVYTGVKAMTYRDAPEPNPDMGENLIQVEAVGICGSDMHGYLGHDERRPAPLILGHEAAGTVIEGPLAGKRVTVNPMVPCGTCETCTEGRENLCPERQLISMPPREGAFAELLRMPSDNLVELPDGFPMDKAAMAEPLAVCWHAIKLADRLTIRPLEHSRCLVLGGGAIGLGSALCLQAFGAGEIVVAETNPLRRTYLAAHAPGAVVDAADLETGYDLVVDAVGYRGTREAASALVKPGGAICHIGLGDADAGLDIRRATLQEITFFGTYCYTKADFRETVDAMTSGRLGPLEWTSTRALSEGSEAFADLLAARVEAPKVILHP
ncbi:L-threonine 3-dehydrogenase [Candidatus Rhodobacter oscarellae]|uniref:L-threonine 3-dehydrogenase n=1 Tax=Candidatus Rhodobacter oscarellae TaxID=1675527 RepID=A0A0J9EF45_9RHOB|nr:alcohol dehydrogenase catalytic domain-containing protein [Candidatus Rhodobacter lobularis]KMW60304.1 L-threonine 3-dehydrogenase [Candidatus Rhodobacter lobularis]